MREKIEELGHRMRSAIWHHPVEALYSVSACLMGCYDYGNDSQRFYMTLQYFPVVFLLAYTLNKCCAGVRMRWLYYFAALLWIPFLAMPVAEPFSSTHLVSLVVALLVFLVSGWTRENKCFVENTLVFFRSLISAGGLSLVIYLLAGSIYKSIQYIFDIWPEEVEIERLIAYTAFVVFGIVFPFLFLLFNERRERSWFHSGSKLFDILLNNVLSPALLIYAVILYLYLIKIAVLWSLPKGAVAAIVVSFTFATFLLKGCQVFLTRRYYDWFYDHASLAALPALAMFWIGTLYRVREYGFTEPRVYLVVVGLILTGTAVLFLMRRWASYLYAACWAILLLAGATYIPGITAKDIERVSQTSRGNYPMKRDLGVEYIHISSDKPIDIRGYHTMESLRDAKDSDVVRLRAKNDTLAIYDKEDVLLYQRSYDEFWDGQLRKVGLSRLDSIPEAVYPDLLRIELDSSAVILESIDLRRDSVSHIDYIVGSCYLK
ncbi:MAG: DUF4153 domain-containing protein [Parabacteroides sp.]|nr:DUF4153 domain-containing protein [Parabacteroides sp.]